MRLRRLELVVIAVTLAFVCFMGGYLIGRSGGTVSVSPVSVHQDEVRSVTPTHPVVQTTQPSPERSSETVSAEPNSAARQPDVQSVEQAPVMPPLSSRDSDGRININTASRSELTDLPGIGSSLSERIVDYRNENGPFRSIEELRNVSGIGEKRYEAIMNKVTVGG